MPRRPRRPDAGASALWRKGVGGSSLGGAKPGRNDAVMLAMNGGAPHLVRMPIAEKDIDALVARFYGRARQDALLGPVFARAVGTADADWVDHLARIAAFWSSTSLGSGRYKGDPFSVHLALPELTPAMFARWLELWAEATEAQFPPATMPGIAQAFQQRAERIARSLQLGLFERPGRPAQEMPSTSAIE
jgi:hemoglobin